MGRGSSKIWLSRRDRDYYVRQAHRDGYRSRAVYKLEEISAARGLIRQGLSVVDLGASPGSWSQWLIGAVGTRGNVVAVDIAEIVPIEGVKIICSDINRPGLASEIKALLGGLADFVLSDCGAAMIGHRSTDQIRAEQMGLEAYALARKLLRKRGGFLVKVRQGGTKELQKELLAAFGSVRFVKPQASRRDSAEVYLLAREFKGV